MLAPLVLVLLLAAWGIVDAIIQADPRPVNPLPDHSRSLAMVLGWGLFRVRVARPIIMDVLLGPTLWKSITLFEGTENVQIQLGDNQFTTIHVTGLDPAGLPGVFAHPPAWSVDDPSVVTITPSDDGATCRVEAAAPPKLGNAVVTLTDVDDATVPALTFEVAVAAEAVNHFGVTVDPPQERPAA